MIVRVYDSCDTCREQGSSFCLGHDAKKEEAKGYSEDQNGGFHLEVVPDRQEKEEHAQ